MKKLWSILGIIALGLLFLTGCGDRQTDGIESIQPVVIGSSDTVGRAQSNQDQIILTLGACETPWELTNAVNAYNARNGKYYVEIVDYGQKYQDYDTAQERLKLDLAASKGTDIIWVGDLAADELGYAGVLADLNTYLTPENREKYLTNILECARTGDALYEIAATFELAFIAGD